VPPDASAETNNSGRKRQTHREREVALAELAQRQQGRPGRQPLEARARLPEPDQESSVLADIIELSRTAG